MNWNDEVTVTIEHVYHDGRLVGTVYIYPRHCEAVPSESGSNAYLYLGTDEAKDWLRLRFINKDAADVFASRHSQGPANGV